MGAEGKMSTRGKEAGEGGPEEVKAVCFPCGGREVWLFLPWVGAPSKQQPGWGLPHGEAHGSDPRLPPLDVTSLNSGGRTHIH